MLLSQPNSARGRLRLSGLSITSLRSRPLQLLVLSDTLKAPVAAELSAWTASFGYPGYSVTSLRSKPLNILISPDTPKAPVAAELSAWTASLQTAEHSHFIPQHECSCHSRTQRVDGFVRLSRLFPYLASLQTARNLQTVLTAMNWQTAGTGCRCRQHARRV